jgi:hypothetical protein
MATETVNVRDAIVYRSHEYPHRWYDAFGAGVSKYIQDFQGYPVDNTTFLPTEFVTTLVNASTAVPTDVAGGAMLITTAGADNDGVKLQLGSTAGESIDLSGPYPFYLGCELAASVVTQADLLVGLCVTDTTCLDGVTDGIYFRNVDGSALLYAVTEKDSIEGATAVATLVAGSYITVEIYFDGATLYFYVNGVLKSSKARTDATFPNDELMRLTLEFLTGDNAAITCTVKWIRVIQVI